MRIKAVAVFLPILSMMVAVHGAAAQPAPKRHGASAAPANTVRPNPPRPQVPPPPPAQMPPPTPPPVTPAPTPSPFAAGPSTYAPHYTSPPARPRRFRPLSPGYGYAFPLPAVVAEPVVEPRDLSGGQQDASGSLELDVEPHTAQVYVDGFYIGTVEDFRRTGVALPAGRYQVDLRAPGYETLTIAVEIDPARLPPRFRGVLTALPAPPAQPTQSILPRRPEKIYVIPGCYAGNRPPQESPLARGC